MSNVRPTSRVPAQRAIRISLIALATMSVGVGLGACGQATGDAVSESATASATTQATVPAGSLNGAFKQQGSGLNQPVDAVATQTVGGQDMVLVGGRFTANGDDSVQYLARLRPDGTTDSAFKQAGKGLNGRVRTVAVQSDGKILVGGEFTAYNGADTSYIVRLDSDGSLDKTFTAPKLSKPVWAITVQSDGKILVGGLFAKTADNPAYLVRLDSDGAVDGSFKGAGLNGYVKGLAVQSDGKIVIGGSFTSPRVNLARLNADGTLDATFAPAGGLVNDGYVDAVSVQADGKVNIAGWFTTYGGASAPRVARLTSSGTLDTSFAAQSGGLNAPVKSMIQQSDGKLLVGGDFTAYGSTAAPSVARINTDGSLDSSFAQTGKGLNGNINSIALAPSGVLAVGGAFSAYDTTTITNVAELFTSSTSDVPSAPLNVIGVAGAKGTITVTWSAPSNSGTSPITGYTATAVASKQKTQTCAAVGTVLTCTITGLTGGPQYDVTVTATNAAGTGPASSPPVKVTPK